MPETKPTAVEPSAAESLDKKSVRTSPMLWILGAVFAGLLGWLGTQGMSDLADLFHEPQTFDFKQAEREALQRESLRVSSMPDARQTRLERAQSDVTALDQALSTAEAGWRTWLATRETLGGNAGEDKELRARRDRLDTLRNERDRAAQELAKITSEPDPRAAALQEVSRKQEALERAASGEYDAAHITWKLKVLAARLGLVLPVWGFAVLLWSRREGSRYITLLWGYWAFAVWMLFWGVVPYLPHYGGYIPLSIGVVSCLWLSVSLVRFFNRRAPLRRRRIVDKAIARHCCPNCERDYLIGQEVSIDLALGRKGATRHFDVRAVRPSACSACGLALFGKCGHCEHQQVVHLDNCGGCGAPWAVSPGVRPQPEPAV